MNEYLITFRSLTSAQQARSLLTKRGISAELQRTPRMLAQRGCGFSVVVRNITRAMEVLRGNRVNYSRLFQIQPGGSILEVSE